MKTLLLAFVLPAAALFGEPNRVAFSDVASLPADPPKAKISYGSEPQQFGELRVPTKKGPHPLVVVIHGGCWGNFADARYTANLASRLASAGAATWNIEFRLVHQEGGGWPGTIQDVGKAIDHVQTFAKANQIDLKRVVTTGHSAGGHLAAWAAGRKHIGKQSPLYSANPLPVSAVVAFGGIVDLEAFEEYGRDPCGDRQLKLIGGVSKEFPDRYRAASPFYLLPLGVPQTLLFGDLDRTVPGKLFGNYVAEAKRKGDRVTEINVPTAGHFEFLMPGTEAEKLLFDSLLRAAKLR